MSRRLGDRVFGVKRRGGLRLLRLADANVCTCRRPRGFAAATSQRAGFYSPRPACGPGARDDRVVTTRPPDRRAALCDKRLRVGTRVLSKDIERPRAIGSAKHALFGDFLRARRQKILVWGESGRWARTGCAGYPFRLKCRDGWVRVYAGGQRQFRVSETPWRPAFPAGGAKPPARCPSRGNRASFRAGGGAGSGGPGAGARRPWGDAGAGAGACGLRPAYGRPWPGCSGRRR